jgi:hypothetical protein
MVPWRHCPITDSSSRRRAARSASFRFTSARWDYRAKADARYKLMTLDLDEFIRRFLIHVLPDGFHRIRHYGFLANGNRTNSIALARKLPAMPDPTSSSSESDGTEGGHADEERNPCPSYGVVGRL